MNQSEIKTMAALSAGEVANTFGGYAPPDGWRDDMLNPPAVPADPQPFDPKVWWGAGKTKQPDREQSILRFYF